MKSLIAYTTETGTAAFCARELAKYIPGCTLCNLKDEKPDPTPYDIVVVGTSVRMGAFNKEACEYLDFCAPILKEKRLGVFLCCGEDEKSPEYLRSFIPEELYPISEKISFGGRLDPDGALGLDRFMIKLMLRSQKKSGSPMTFHPERIPAFAEKLTGK